MSLMIIASASQFHVYIFFQLGEGPSRGLLRDYEPSDGPSFQALVAEMSLNTLLRTVKNLTKTHYENSIQFIHLKVKQNMVIGNFPEVKI